MGIFIGGFFIGFFLQGYFFRGIFTGGFFIGGFLQGEFYRGIFIGGFLFSNFHRGIFIGQFFIGGFFILYFLQGILIGDFLQGDCLPTSQNTDHVRIIFFQFLLKLSILQMFLIYSFYSISTVQIYTLTFLYMRNQIGLFSHYFFLFLLKSIFGLFNTRWIFFS